ncbi:MAG: outer membrane lipoprotein carrier protein LolA [Desulfovibrio sp.]|jgi:outer membrane lipoprotein carrier protein|nr:outer membrane lipoprotein carrier protein LolA [Desulfovibrio sp.]
MRFLMCRSIAAAVRQAPPPLPFRTLLFCAALFFSLLRPAPPGFAADGDTDAALRRIRTLTSSINTLRCSFTQTTAVPMFTEPVVSEGRLFFKKPDSLLWEYTAPYPQGLVFSGGKGFRWEDDKNRRKPFTTSGDPVAGLIASQMSAWIRFDRDLIESRYVIRADDREALTFELTPKSAELRSVLVSLRITFADNGAARSVLLRERAGGSTLVRLHDMVVNGLLEDREFR